MKIIKKGPAFARPFFILYLPIPEPGPAGVSVDPLGESLGPSVLPDGVRFGLAGPVVVEPAEFPVVPVVDEPVLVPVPADQGQPAGSADLQRDASGSRKRVTRRNSCPIACHSRRKIRQT